MIDSLPVIGIIGGTGNLGVALAKRWIEVGYQVIIGSRTLSKAQATVETYFKTLTISAPLLAKDNISAANDADIAVLTVPFAHQADILNSIKEQLIGKILVDTTVPLVPPNVTAVQLPEYGSAGQTAQTLLGDEVRVVSAFQNAAAHHLLSRQDLDCDILVCGNDEQARSTVIKLVEATGLRGFHAGTISNATAVEAMTSLLIFMNKHYKIHAGVKITGLY